MIQEISITRGFSLCVVKAINNKFNTCHATYDIKKMTIGTTHITCTMSNGKNYMIKTSDICYVWSKNKSNSDK